MYYYRKSFFVISFLVVTFLATSQVKLGFSKAYVKKDAVILRWVPTNKTVYKSIMRNGLKITRFEKENGKTINPVMLSNNLKPYLSKDTLKWAFLLKDVPDAVISYKVITGFENNTPQSGKTQEVNEKMFYDLMLLSADFNSKIAKASGLYFKDSTIISGKEYFYKIELNNNLAKIAPVTIEVNSGILSANPDIDNLSHSVKGKVVKLKWKTTELRTSFSGYNVERSTDSINFTKINTSPVILLSTQFEKQKDEIVFDDTCSDVNKIYYYRIYGINFFGEFSKPSNVIAVKFYNDFKSFPVIDSIQTINNQKVFLRWKMKEEIENKHVKEFVLLRSKKDSGPYDVIYKTNQPAQFIDEKPESSNYYKIGAVSYGNDTAYSYSSLALIIDSIPPLAPKDLKAKVDLKGNVTLTWEKNEEKDLQGYKIFKANALNEEFVQISNKFIYTNEFKDKLNLKTLSKKIYYRVVATDNRFNNSDFSEPIEVKRPDTIAPIAPIINNLKMVQNGIEVSWILSNSDDVKQYVLYRQDMKINCKEEKIKDWLAKDSLKTFLDTNLTLGESYRFKIVVIDEDDNISVSNYPFMKFETGYRKKISNIQHNVDRTEKKIGLEWDYPINEIEKYIIYRSKNTDPYTIIKTIPAVKNQFEDKELNMGNIYSYKIKAVYKIGVESILSDEVKIEY